MQGAQVVGGRDGDGGDPEPAAGAKDPHGDLAAICDQDLLDALAGRDYLLEPPLPLRVSGTKIPGGGVDGLGVGFGAGIA